MKLVPATRDAGISTELTAKVVQVGADGMPELSLMGIRNIRLLTVTAVVLTVYVVVVVGTTTTPDAAAPQAAGDTELTAQFVVVK